MKAEFYKVRGTEMEEMMKRGNNNERNMKLLEIHKNGINAHYKTVSYYGLDYEKKKVLFEVKTLEEAIEKGSCLGYKNNEIVIMF